MSEKLGGGYLAIRADKTQLRGDLDAAKGMLGGWLQSLNGMLSTVGIGLSVAAVFSTLQEASGAAEDAERSFKRLEGIVTATGEAAGFTAKELADMAGDLQKAIGYSDESIMNAQSTLLTFKKVTGDTFREAISLGTDLAETFGGGEGGLRGTILQLGKALEDPIRGITALRRSGVSFTEDEKKKIKALVESNQLLKAQQIILAAVRGQVGGAAAKAASGPFGELRKARMQVDEAKETLGRSLLPLQTMLVNAQAGWIHGLTIAVDLFNQIAPAINGLLNPMEGFTGKLIVGTVAAMGLVHAFPQIVAGIRAMQAAAMVAFRVIKMGLISTGWGAFIVILGAAIALLLQLGQMGMQSKAFMDGWPAVAEKFGAAWQAAGQLVQAVWAAVASVINAALAALGFNSVKISEDVGGAMIQALDFVANFVLAATAYMLTMIENSGEVWKLIKQQVNLTMAAAGDYVAGFFMFFVRTAQSAVMTILRLFQEIPAVIQAIFRGEDISSAVGGALQRVSQRFRAEMMDNLNKSMTLSPETKRLQKERDETLAGLTAKAQARMVQLIAEQRKKDEPAKGGKRGPDVAGPTVSEPKFTSGLRGFEEFNKMMQEAFLKADDPQQKLVGLAEENNELQAQQLAALKKIEEKPGIEVADE